LADMVTYVTSIYPTADLVALVRRINPDFFFCTLETFEELGGKVSAWLNVSCSEALEMWWLIQPRKCIQDRWN
jgi:hypothetical protein